MKDVVNNHRIWQIRMIHILFKINSILFGLFGFALFIISLGGFTGNVAPWYGICLALFILIAPQILFYFSIKHFKNFKYYGRILIIISSFFSSSFEAWIIYNLIMKCSEIACMLTNPIFFFILLLVLINFYSIYYLSLSNTKALFKNHTINDSEKNV